LDDSKRSRPEKEMIINWKEFKIKGKKGVQCLTRQNGSKEQKSNRDVEKKTPGKEKVGS